MSKYPRTLSLTIASYFSPSTKINWSHLSCGANMNSFWEMLAWFQKTKGKTCLRLKGWFFWSEVGGLMILMLCFPYLDVWKPASVLTNWETPLCNLNGKQFDGFCGIEEVECNGFILFKKSKQKKEETKIEFNLILQVYFRPPHCSL